MRGDTSQLHSVTARKKTHKLEPSNAGLAIRLNRGNDADRDEGENTYRLPSLASAQSATSEPNPEVLANARPDVRGRFVKSACTALGAGTLDAVERDKRCSEHCVNT